MKKKALLMFGLSVSLTLASAFTAFADWERFGDDYRYKNDDGTYAVNQWKESGDWYMDKSLDTSKDKWHYFGSDGKMIRNRWYYHELVGLWRYFGEDGVQVMNSWVGNYYVADEMLTNTWTPDGYYVGEDGAWVPEAGRRQ